MERFMKKVLCALLLSGISTSCFAGFAGDVEVTNITLRDTGETTISLSAQPNNACSHWGWHMKFDASTTVGQMIYGTLLTAKTGKRKVHVWFTDATATKADEIPDVGCPYDKMAVLTSVALP